MCPIYTSHPVQDAFLGFTALAAGLTFLVVGLSMIATPLLAWRMRASPLPAELGPKAAGHGRRLAAFVVDAVVLLFVVGGLDGWLDARIVGYNAGGMIPLVVLYFVVANRLGSSIGMRILGIRVVKSDGAQLGWVRALGRAVALGGVIAWTLSLVGLIIVVTRPIGRQWHDLATQTVAIRTSPTL